MMPSDQPPGTSADQSADGPDSSYAWQIVADHWYDRVEDPAGLFKDARDNEAGTYGPRTAAADLIDALHAPISSDEVSPTPRNPTIRAALFRMYGADGDLYYSGFLAYRVAVTGQRRVLAGPLFDFGLPNAGCTRIVYPYHPDWAVTATLPALRSSTATSTLEPANHHYRPILRKEG